jgi:hypothetical protein
MSFWSNTVTRFSAAYTAFMNPGSTTALRWKQSRESTYAKAWYYYRNLTFSPEISDWTVYLADREIYKKTRLIYNPVPGIVDFYVDNIWKTDESIRELEDSLITPLSAKTDPAIIAAVAQLDQWSNWESEKQKVKRFAAATGNCLLQMVDDLEREKILQETVEPWNVKEIELNNVGDVQSYIIEKDVWDSELKKSYKYRKEVTKEFFAFYRDDRLYDDYENPYQYCPAVWFKHIDDGNDEGLSAFSDFNKVNETNGLTSHAHDDIHKEIESGKLIGVDNPSTIQVLTGGSVNSDGTINETDPRLDRVLLAAKNTNPISVHDLSGDLKLAEAREYINDLKKSFKEDYPELSYLEILRELANASGEARKIALTPAQNRLDNAQGYYNRQLIKFRQMQISAAGWRTKNGWLNNTPQQQVFAPFNLDSYEKGKIDFQLKQSKLISETEAEREDILLKKANRAVSLAGIVNQQEQLKIVGYVEKDIPTVAADTTEPKQLGAGLPVEE